MKFNINKLEEIATPLPEETLRQMAYRRENRGWLLKSARIAVELHRLLRSKGMTQKELASQLGVSPAQVSKILKGTENLGLKTICKIEKAIGMELVTVPGQHAAQGAMTVETDVPVVVCQPSSYVGDTTFGNKKTMRKYYYQQKNYTIA